MIYTADMLRTAVESASRGARDVARAEERDRVCQIIAAHAHIESSEAAREALWECIRQIRGEELSS
jgi:16S rRNA G966 N2-methylase RsmD